MADNTKAETITDTSKAGTSPKPKVGIIIIGSVLSLATLFTAAWVIAKGWKIGSK